MKRIRLTTGPVAIFGALFVIALILFLPMRLGLSGLGTTGLTARQVSGSVWWGALAEAHVGALELGDLRARLSPVQLFVGRARVSLDGRDDLPARAIHGAIGISRNSFGLDDLTGSLAAGNVFAPVPVSAIDLDDVSVRFQDGICQSAEGRVRATLSGDMGGLPIAQGLSGTARCDGGALLLPLVSQGGGEAVALKIWQTGRFRADLTLQPSDPAVAAKLQLGGFQPRGNGYGLSIEGRF